MLKSPVAATHPIKQGSALVGLFSLLLYGFVYTPLKRVGPIAVFVGAFPGAFPPMIGWVAATNHFTLEPGILFAIQFFWQFPHFWAIGWFLYEDYEKAGIFMLPTGKKDKACTKILDALLFLIAVSWTTQIYIGKRVEKRRFFGSWSCLLKLVIIIFFFFFFFPGNRNLLLLKS